MVSGRLFFVLHSPGPVAVLSRATPRPHCGGPAGVTGWEKWGGLMDSPGVPWGCTAPWRWGSHKGFLTGQLLQQVPWPSWPTHPQRSLLLGALGSRHETRKPEASTCRAHSIPLPPALCRPSPPDPARVSKSLPAPDPSRLGPSANATSGKPPLLLSVESFAWQGQSRSASQLKSRGPPRALPGTSRPRNTVPRAPRVHFRSDSRPRNGQRMVQTEATDGWATRHQSSQG